MAGGHDRPFFLFNQIKINYFIGYIDKVQVLPCHDTMTMMIFSSILVEIFRYLIKPIKNKTK